MKPLVLKGKSAKLPIIQGGMGVGVSLSKLAGAVAAEGGVGVISSAQIGFDEPDFAVNTRESNIRALKRHIREAASACNGGLVGVNIMVALKDYREHVKAAIEAGADVIISGAGLPIDLPGIAESGATALAPIVSSAKAANVILSMWERKYKRTADCIIIEGPEAGGHLGFTFEELEDIAALHYDDRIREIIKCVRTFEEKFNTHIPVIIAGGIFDRADAEHALELGADGIQAATRFVATEECDADWRYKQAYINAGKDDIRIVKSPVGMPGRAVDNAFLRRIADEKEDISKCFGCLASCVPKQVPYCITQALIRAVRGDTDNGLIFCGSNVDRIHEITTVHNIMQELTV